MQSLNWHLNTGAGWVVVLCGTIRPVDISRCAVVFSPADVAVIDTDMLWSTSKGFLLTFAV